MRIFIPIIGFTFIWLYTGCNIEERPAASQPEQSASTADSFAYPLGGGNTLTEAKDTNDGWFNALDLGEDNHLGEDWNRNTGGNTDCGEPVHSIGNGVITYAADAGPGWGNVIIVTHLLPDGSKVQSLYGHLQEILKSQGEVKLRDKIGKIGNANGRYYMSSASQTARAKLKRLGPCWWRLLVRSGRLAGSLRFYRPKAETRAVASVPGSGKYGFEKHLELPKIQLALGPHA